MVLPERDPTLGGELELLQLELAGLTYDRDGQCVEGAGIPVDLAVGGSDADVLAVAETL